MKSLSTLALLLGQQVQAQDVCHLPLIQGLLRISGCEGDCTNCHVDNVNQVLCPNDLCCTIDGVGQAAGDTAVGTTTPTICTSAQQPSTASCATAGAACTHLGHPGTCNADLLCEDLAVCSDSKLEHIATCAANCNTCTSALITPVLNGCLVADGATDIQAYGTTFCASGKCTGNADSLTDVTCSAGSALKAAAWSIDGTDEAACCELLPTCTAMDLAAIQAAGYSITGAADATTVEELGDISCHSTHVAEDAQGTVTIPSVSCDGSDFVWSGCTAIGTCSSDAVSCPNSNPLVNYNTANGADAASCCESVTGKCTGNTDSSQDFACPTGYDLKSNPSTIASAASDADDARVATCCDAQTCGANICTTGYTAKADQTLAAGTAATLTTCCDAETCGSDVCTDGYTAKADQTLAAGTAASVENCCDASPPPPPTSPTPASTSGATSNALAAATLLSIALANGC